MSYSPDNAIIRLRDGITSCLNQAELAGSDPQKVLIRSGINDVLGILNELHEKDGEPAFSYSWLVAESSLTIAVGYLISAINDLREGNELVGLGQCWQSLSYLQMGAANIYEAERNP